MELRMLARRDVPEETKRPLRATRVDLEEAYNRMELLEQTCMSVVYATILGGVHHIPPAEMEFFVANFGLKHEG